MWLGSLLTLRRAVYWCGVVWNVTQILLIPKIQERLDTAVKVCHVGGVHSRARSSPYAKLLLLK